jgi:hypothetical protein
VKLETSFYQSAVVTGSIIPFLVSYSHSMNKYFLFNLKNFSHFLFFYYFFCYFLDNCTSKSQANGLVVVAHCDIWQHYIKLNGRPMLCRHFALPTSFFNRFKECGFIITKSPVSNSWASCPLL